MTSLLEVALSKTAQKVSEGHKPSEAIEQQRITTIDIALGALEGSFEAHPEYIIPDQHAAIAYAGDFERYLNSTLADKSLSLPITTHIDLRVSRVDNRSQGTRSVIVGRAPTLRYQVWVELKGRYIRVYWEKVTLN